MTSELKKTVRHFLLLRSVTAFGTSFLAAFYVSFLIAKGLNLLEVNLVNFFFYTMLFIFEIPTGAFADVFGRKLSFLLFCLLFCVGMIAYGLMDTFWGFVSAEVILAIGSTFASGAFKAWFIDRMLHQGYTGSFAKFWTWEQQLTGSLGIISAVAGAFLATWNLSLPWFIGGGILAVSGILALVYMNEEQFERKPFSFRAGSKAMLATVHVSWKYALDSNAVRFILIVGVVQWFALQAPNMQWQPFFTEFLPSPGYLGFVYAAMPISIMTGSSLAPWFLRKIKDEKIAISFTQIMIGSGVCLTVAFSNFAPALSMFLLHEMARGLFVPLKDVYLNDNIPSSQRATLISFDSLTRHIGGMIGLPVSGAIAEYVSLPSAWIFSGLALIISALIFFRNGDRA